MVEDILTDGEYVESGVRFTEGLIAGSLVTMGEKYSNKEDPTKSESMGRGVLTTAVVDAIYEAAEYAGIAEDDFGKERYPEYWAGVTLAHYGVRKVDDMLEEE